MVKPTEGLNVRENKNSRSRESVLVLNVDRNGKILRFNKECERILGISKKEVLNRQLFDFLIPERYFDQWEEIFDYARQHKHLNDLELPILTQHGREIMVSWSGFPTNNAAGLFESIGLIGKLVPQKDNVNGFSSEHVKKQVGSKADGGYLAKKGKGGGRALCKFGNKQVVLKKGGHTRSKDFHGDVKTKIPSKKAKKQKNLKKDIHSKKVKVETEKLTEKNEEILKDHNDVKKKIKKLEMINAELEKENKKLGKNLSILQTRLDNEKTKQQKRDKTYDPMVKKNAILFNRGTHFLFDCIGGSRKKEEFERMMYELDERKSLLDDFESQIVDDRRNLADSRSEFCRWKEKLELLEDEIERRRVEVVEQEKTLNERVTSPLAGGIHNESAFEVDGEISSDVSGSDIETIEHHNVLDKTVQCAAIIQRGILKQINGSFAELIGFETDEIMNKSLFDFIAPEGLADLEKYYLNRLKGFDSYTYGTVFSTKDNGKILVEVSIKPTTYEGKKAEIAIIKELENK